MLSDTEKDIVVLNVGGIEFTTTAKTLEQRGGAVKRLLLDVEPLRDAQGRIFVDIDGQIFRWVLSYLRGCDSLPKTPEERDMLRQQAEHFGLVELAERLTDFRRDVLKVRF